MQLEPHQNSYIISFRKSFNSMVAVLPDTLDKITGYTRVKRTIALTGHDIRGRLLHGFIPLDSRFRGNDEGRGGNDGEDAGDNEKERRDDVERKPIIAPPRQANRQSPVPPLSGLHQSPPADAAGCRYRNSD